MSQRWSDQETEDLAKLFLRGRQAVCPRCSTPVKANLSEQIGRTTADVILHCPRCQSHGEYSPEHLEAMRLAWNKAEKKAIEDAYWKRGGAVCPKDGAVLSVHQINQLSGPSHLMVHCRLCGRNFQSGDEQDEMDPTSYKAQYRELRTLDTGGMGVVVLAQKTKTGHQFACKKIRPEYVKSAALVARFKREIRILAALDHRNIVKIHDHFLDDDGLVFVMEYLPGGDLKQKINDSSVSTAQLARLFADVCSGVAHIHAQKIVHRDLKPQNVMIDASGTGKVTDLGLATFIDRDSTALTRTAQFLGTRAYAAPEQQAGARDVDYRADIFSVGLIAYEILTRRSPHSSIRIVSTEPVWRAIANALEDDPKVRTITLDQLVAAVVDHLTPGSA